MKRFFGIFICVCLSSSIYAQKLGVYEYSREFFNPSHGNSISTWTLELKNNSEFIYNCHNDLRYFSEIYSSFGKYYIKKDTLFLLSPVPSNKITISNDSSFADTLIKFSLVLEPLKHISINANCRERKIYFNNNFSFYTISKENQTTEIKPLFIEVGDNKYFINLANRDGSKFDYEREYEKDEYEDECNGGILGFGTPIYDEIVNFYFKRQEIKSYLQAIDNSDLGPPHNFVVEISDNKISNYKIDYGSRSIGLTEDEHNIIFLDVSTYKFLLKDGQIISINKFGSKLGKAKHLYNLNLQIKK